MNENPQRERPRKQTTGFKPTRRQVLAASGATMAGLVAAHSPASSSSLLE
jgi:hypothetical protein